MFVRVLQRNNEQDVYRGRKRLTIRNWFAKLRRLESPKMRSWQVGDPGKSTVMVSFQSEFKVPAQEPAGSRPKKS